MGLDIIRYIGYYRAMIFANHLHHEAHGMRWFMRGHGGHGPGRRHEGGGRGKFGGRGRGRGDLKYEILTVLTDGPRHGYDIMDEIERREGMRPSPGSVYPALQMLADGDFVTSSERDGKRVYEITEKGRTLLTERPARETSGDEDDERSVFIAGAKSMRALFGAAQQVARSGDRAAIEKATAIIDAARREIYSLLADLK